MNDWPDGESVLSQFRDWLEQTCAEADALGPDEEPGEGTSDFRPVGLVQLIEEFTALKHELKLETKSGRHLCERSEETVAAMREAIDQFRAVEARESAAAERGARPLVEALVDLEEALRRGRAALETARRRILEESAEELERQFETLYRQQPWWRRRIARRWREAVHETCRKHRRTVDGEILDALVAGYDLIFRRLERAMKEEGIYRMQCGGKPADPNAMTVIEVVDDPGRPPGLVTEEVRPGYYWNGKVFRYAEVRAVREGTSAEQGD